MKMEEWKYSSFNAYFNNNENICDLELARKFIDIPRDSKRFYRESYDMILEDDIKKII
jgi:hypothetical protein